MNKPTQRHITIVAIVVTFIGIGLFLYNQPLNEKVEKIITDHTWHTVGWEPCIDGKHAVVKECINKSSGITVDNSLCPQPKPVEQLACEDGKKQRVSCCTSKGDCEKNWLYTEGYRCCGKTYSDYAAGGTYQCCNHGNEKFPDGCAVSPGNSCAACGN